MKKVSCIRSIHLRLFILFVTILLSRVDFVQAQQDRMELVFEILNTTDGLPTNEVQKTYQDKEGFLWFATRNGLCKYDGYQITVYNSNQHKPKTLTSNLVFDVTDDNTGNLWIGTHNGIDRFNKLSGKFEPIEIKGNTSKMVLCVLATKSNEIWIGLNDGLFKYDADEDAFVHHSLRGIGNIAITSPVKSIIEDSSGRLWIGTASNGLYRYSRSNNIFYNYPRLDEGNSVHAIYEDSKKNIWIGTWGEGVHLLEFHHNMENIQWKTYKHDANDAASIPDNYIYDICEDINTNTFWIGTRGGLSILQHSHSTSFINWSSNHETNQLPCNEINSIQRDSKDNIWLGSMGGGVLFTNTKKAMFDSVDIGIAEAPSNTIRAIFSDTNNTIWLGIGSHGIAQYDSSSDKIISQSSIPGFDGMRHLTINDINQRHSGEMLFATYGEGLWVYERGKLTTYTLENSEFISNNRIQSLHMDRNNNCWIGTRYGLGVWLDDNSGFTFNDIIINSTPLESLSIIDITEDETGRIWLATIGNGLVSIEGNPLNKEELTFKSYTVENKKIPTHTINVFHYDTSGRFWAGGEDGKLYMYDNESDSFIDKSPPFSILGSLISSIEEDQWGNLWVGTSNGLVRLTYNIESKPTRYRVFTTNDGLCDNFFIPKSSMASKEELYFGCYNGLARVNPGEINVNLYPTPFYITDRRILNTSFHKLDEEIALAISEKVPPFSDRITIPHKYNNLSIYFSNLNYNNVELNRYAYKLDGLDQSWVYTDSKQNAAYYNNLPPGHYVFQLRSTMQNGVWNDKIKEIKISVLLPPWLSWWAFVLYFCMFVLIGYGIYRNLRNRIHLRNQLRYKEVEQEKTQELNHAKLQFFTNITHEFLTPLTIISATAEELEQVSPRKDNLYGTMQQNITRLTGLLQQILEFRKAESNNLQLRVSYGNISEFIDNTTKSFFPLIKSKKIHFSYLSDPDNIQGLFDTDKLDKILYNLISNAAKYVSKGGFIQVTLSYHDKEKKQIRLSVNDNGAGIDEEDQKTLFNRFYEGNYRKHNTTGTGIGLSLVKELVELHHGTVQVKSEVNKGSNFTVILPIDPNYFEETEIDSEQPEPAPETSSIEVPLEDEEELVTTNKKIFSVLVVEDNEEILSVINRLLNKDYQVFTATNGKKALSVLKNNNVDVIVSDIMMPEMDGIELCKKLKSDIEYSHIPIVLLTAKNDPSDRAEAYESGADAFISKPFSINVLHARIKNLLTRQDRIARDFKSQLVFEIKDLNFTSLDEEFLQKAIDCVNSHLSNSDFDQQQFAKEMSVSKSTLYNKLRTLTGLNTSAFITNIRLKAACQIMNQNRTIRISDLAYDVGFNDPKYFSSCFKKEFKMRPTEYIESLTTVLQQDE